MAEFRAVEFDALPQGLTGLDHDETKLWLVREGDDAGLATDFDFIAWYINGR